MSEVEFDNRLTDEVKVSEEALFQLSGILEQEPDAAGLRIYISGGGCSGMTYGMTLVEKPTPFDCVLETEKLNIYVDTIALGYLTGVEIDFKSEGLNHSFVFKNVFSQTGGSGSCGGCGGAAPAGGGGGGCA